MRLHHLLGLAGFFIAGCAVPPKPITTPDGKRGFAISCGALANCYSRAGEACRGPYSTIDKQSNVSGSQYGFVTTFTMVVECKD